MKKIYPSYQTGLGTKPIEEGLKKADLDILNEFCKFCRVSASENRVNTKIRCYMLQTYDVIGKSFSDWKVENIRDFVILVNDSNKTEWTKNDIKKILRRFLKWKYKKSDDLEEMLNLIKCKSDMNAFNHKRINESTLVTPEEFESVLRQANTLKQKAILSLLFETAIRPQELRNLKWCDVKINEEIGSIVVFSGKTKKSRTIPIKDSIVHLQRWKQEYEFNDVRNDDFIFPNPKDRLKSLSNNTLPVMLKRLSIKLGLKRNIFPYLLRHSKITDINKKLPAHLESKFAGHSIKQAQLYTHLSSDDLKDAMIEKVFGVKEITPENKSKFEKDIKMLNEKLDEFEKMDKEREERREKVFRFIEMVENNPMNIKPKMDSEGNLVFIVKKGTFSNKVYNK